MKEKEDKNKELRIRKRRRKPIRKKWKEEKCEGKKIWKVNRNIGEEKKNLERKGHVRNKEEIKGETSERKIRILKGQNNKGVKAKNIII